MRLSTVKVILSENDVMDLIKEYVKVEDLAIEKVQLGDLIKVTASYKKVLKVGFELSASIEGVEANVIQLKIHEIKTLKVHILDNIKDFAVKSLVKNLESFGVSEEDNYLYIDLEAIKKLIPEFNFQLISLNSFDGQLVAEINSLQYNAKAEAEIKSEVEDANVEYDEDAVEEGAYRRTIDKYSDIRGTVKKSLPESISKISDYLFILPDMIALLVRLIKDSRVSFKTRIVIGIIAAYLISPIDLLPDFIPFIGEIEDLLIAIYGLNLIFNKIPEDIVLENWEGNGNIIHIVKDALKFINKFLGGENYGRIAKIIETAVFGRNKQEKN